MSGERAENFLRMIRRAQRGRLRIYLGYAAGVGKTYQMLEEAHRLCADGISVVVGIVETHGRSETTRLLDGLAMLPRRNMRHHGIVLEEFDLDAVLARKPDVVLVDELAHTNVPGSRNAKRWQDVEEILAAGIHVISTLNVQHLESLYETVERATGVRVRERIPDRVVAEADSIVNVDITPEDLRRRLMEGKVYTSERIETALAHFFTESNLGQLRELTLRELAAQIDARSRDPEIRERGVHPDQVMVCLSSRGPNSEALLRHASRLAGRLNRNWYAVYVQTSRERPAVIDAATQRALANTLTLAQQLGATVFTYRGDDVVKTILRFASEYRVGHIVIGSPGKRPSFIRRLWGATGVVERLISECRGSTVVVCDTAVPVMVVDDAPAGDLDIPLHRIRVWNTSIDKEAAMRQLLEVSLSDDVRDAAWRALLEREAQGVTFVGEDVAIPHAKLAGVSTPLVALGLAQEGICDQSSGQRVRIMFLLLSPSDAPRIHLTVLATICRLAQDDQWRRAVLTSRVPADAAPIIMEWKRQEGKGYPR